MSKPPPAFWQDPEGDGGDVVLPSEPDGADDRAEPDADAPDARTGRADEGGADGRTGGR